MTQFETTRLVLRAPLLAALAALPSCGDLSEGASDGFLGAIRDGQPAPDLDEVVALARDGQIFCSAVLIDATHAVTAAHCLEQPDFRVQLEVAGRPPLSVSPLRVRIHPRYVPGSETDIGILLLPAVQSTPAQLGDRPPPAGSMIGIGGFGKESVEGTAGIRRYGVALIRAVGPKLLELEPSPAQPCLGDSGGAVFEETPTGRLLVGLLMEGDDQCRSVARAVRIDAYRETFLVPAAARLPATGNSPGQPCQGDLDCQTGYCLDTGHDRYCTSSCSPTAKDGCPAGFQCVGSTDDSPGLFECTRAARPAAAGCSIGPQDGAAHHTTGVLVMALVAGILCRLRRTQRPRPVAYGES